jgi:hypothetical protein
MLEKVIFGGIKMGKYTCPKEGCPYVKEIFYHDGSGIQDVLKHEKEHMGNKKIVTRTEKVPCKHCDGNGYTEETFDIEVDVSEADSGRD